jgi:hypothetical protein
MPAAFAKKLKEETAMDRQLHIDIMTTVRRAMLDCLEDAQEVWLTGEALCKQFGMFTPSWLKRYGHKLPRTRAVVHDETGSHATGWAYPRNKIQRLIRENSIKQL